MTWTEVLESPTPSFYFYGEVVSIPLTVARNIPNAASEIVGPSCSIQNSIAGLYPRSEAPKIKKSQQPSHDSQRCLGMPLHCD